MVHRAICGSMERFTGILIEHFAGHLPLWLSPVQIVIATITQEADDYAEEIGGSAPQARPARRTRPAQRDDRVDPPPRLAAAAVDDARRGARSLFRRGDAAGREAG